MPEASPRRRERPAPDAALAEPVIASAHVVAGHDGEAQLEVRVRYENGALGTVTLDPECARRLLEECEAETPDDLRGQPWQRLLDVLP